VRAALIGNDLRALALANVLRREGHAVVLVPGPTARPYHRDLERVLLPEADGPPWWQVRRVDDILASVARLWADLVLVLHVESSDAGLTEALRLLAARKSSRMAVLGVDRAGAVLETSKRKGLDFARAAGLRPPATVLIPAGAPWPTVESLPFGLPCVVKADGLAGGRGSVIVKTSVEFEIAARALSAGDALIQEFVLGDEVALSLWLAGGQLSVLNLNFEYKRELEGDEGSNTPGMGTVACGHMDERQARAILAQLESSLAAIRYQGPLDVNFVISPDGQPWFLEFTARFGDPELMSEVLMLEDVATMLNACAHNVMAVRPRTDALWSAGIVAVGDEPAGKPQDTSGASLYVMEGDLDIVTCSSAVGDSASLALMHAYAQLDRNARVRFRRDIGHDAEKRAMTAARIQSAPPIQPGARRS